MAEAKIDYKTQTFTCSCGSSYSVRSTIGEDTRIEICSNCHPFYTKKQKLVDTAGRVERFQAQYGTKKADKADKADKKDD